MPGKKILVVDDMSSIVDLFTIKLVAEGYDVCTAQNGVEALAKARVERPLAIIMDVMMPEMSGFEAVKKLREMPETRNVPVIIISAKAGMKDFFSDIAGIDFMLKPVDFGILTRRLTELTGGSQPQTDQSKRVVLAGVEDVLVSRVRTTLRTLHFEVFTALNELDAVFLIKNMKPVMALCQFWEDEHIFSPREIAQQIASDPNVAKTPFYVYCKPALSMEAMKHFDLKKIVTYKETSELLSALEILFRK